MKKIKKTTKSKSVAVKKPKSLFSQKWVVVALVLLGVFVVVNLLKSLFAAPSQVAEVGSVQGTYNNEYYVSPSGSDSNTGKSSSSPFKTFAKAHSVAGANDAIHMLPGTYTETMKITKNNLDVFGYNKAVIDATDKWAAIEIHGSDVLVDGMEAKHSRSHVVYITGKYVTFRNSYVHDGIYENRASNGYAAHSGWGSGVSIKHDVSNGVERMAEHVLIDNVLIERVYGEGLDTYGVNDVRVVNSTIKDAYSIGFYIDNSSNVTFENNFAYCSGDPRFKRNNGDIMAGFAMAIERIERWYPSVKWGPQLYGARIVNNISNGCNGINMWGSEYSGQADNGVRDSLIAHNIVLNTPKGSSLYFAEGLPHRNVRVYNNIVSGSINLPSGVTGAGNITGVAFDKAADNPNDIKPTQGQNKGVVIAEVKSDRAGMLRDSQPDAGAWEFGSTVTAPSAVPTAMPTLVPTSTPTPTPTPAPTKTPTPTPTPKPSVTTQVVPSASPEVIFQTTNVVSSGSNQNPVVKSNWFNLHAIRNKVYTGEFTATDRNLDDNLSLSVTGLPAGLEVTGCRMVNWGRENAVICTVSGTATQAGRYKIAVTAQDDAGGAATANLTFRVW